MKNIKLFDVSKIKSSYHEIDKFYFNDFNNQFLENRQY